MLKNGRKRRKLTIKLFIIIICQTFSRIEQGRVLIFWDLLLFPHNSSVILSYSRSFFIIHFHVFFGLTLLVFPSTINRHRPRRINRSTFPTFFSSPRLRTLLFLHNSFIRFSFSRSFFINCSHVFLGLPFPVFLSSAVVLPIFLLSSPFVNLHRLTN